MAGSDRGSTVDTPKTKYRNRELVLLTVACASGFFVEGLCTSIIGPSLVSMGVILAVDTKTISWAVMGRAFGYFCGTVMSGFIYSKVSKRLMFPVLYFIFGVSTAVCPLGNNVIYFAGMLALQGFANGFADVGAQCLLLNIWTGHKKQASLFQTMFGLWAVGATIGPLVMTPFLTSVQEDIYDNATAPVNLTTNDHSSVIYGYALTGSIAILPIILFLFAFRHDACTLSRDSKFNTVPITKIVSQPKATKTFQIVFKLLVMATLFAFTICDGSMINFLATYAVKGLGWSSQNGSFVTAAYFAGCTVVKVGCIYLFVIFSPRAVLYTVTMTAAVACGLTTLSHLHVSILWMSAVLAGLGLGTIQSCLFLVTERHMSVTGRTASMFMSSSSVAGIIGPLLIGVLVDEMGAGYIPVVFLITAVCQFVSFVSADVYARKKYEIDVDIRANLDEYDSQDQVLSHCLSDTVVTKGTENHEHCTISI